MKHFLSKVKKSCHKFITGKSGFSLVELIVVIAIMAVMAAVLAPALLGYVEKSRMQKDDSAMDEVTNAVQLTIADMNVYDELLMYSVKNNYSCYCDGSNMNAVPENKIFTKEPDYWLYNDNCRLLDETPYSPAGNMRGVTITLRPNGQSEYILKDGIVNKMGDQSTTKGSYAGYKLSNKIFEQLYNNLRSSIGDTIKVSSQTYRNSDYTIFINMGTTGGNQADKQDAIQVYGQYNGTNLSKVATPVAGGNQNANSSESVGPNMRQHDIIPAGAIYYVGVTSPQLGNYSTATHKYKAGETFPDAQIGDIFVYGDYEYRYGMYYTGYESGWRTRGTGWYPRVLDDTKESYESVVLQIDGMAVTSLPNTYYLCLNLKVAPSIHEGITNLSYSFAYCSGLTEKPVIPTTCVTPEDYILAHCPQFGYN